MGYYVDDGAADLDYLRNRLYATDLIPSHQALLEGIDKNFAALELAGCKSMRELRARLKNAKAISSLAEQSGVDLNYLNLLRRAVEGFFPKPKPLAAFDWLDLGVVDKLEKAGIKDSRQLHLAAGCGAETLGAKIGLDADALAELIALSDLSRAQWVSPAFARALYAAGYDNAAKVAAADAETLCQAIEDANAKARFYNGKIGLRDVKRLITAASYVP